MSARRKAAGLLVAATLLAGWTAPPPSPAARAHSGAPRVQSMIVGRHGVVLSRARSILAGPATVRVGGHSCAVAAGTPLAVLAALRRAGGPAFALRDYGHCGASPGNSAELFVSALAGQRNAGRSGWEYKVDGLAGSTGAADPSGPAGNGRRVPAGARVLWFYCETTARGCQRTLTVTSAAASVTAGSPLQVSVGGDDDEGTLAPVVGASVMIGSLSASTDAGGRATLSAPTAPGSYRLTASAPGLVPSFPVEVQVR